MVLTPSNKLVAFFRKAESQGLSPEKILTGSDVRWEDLNALKPIDQNTTATLFDLLARRTPPDFALMCGKESKINDFGIVGLAMASAPFLRDAFDTWARYSVVAAQPFSTTITETADAWQMHFAPQRLMSPQAQRFCLEVSIAANEATIEELTGAPAETLAIDFTFERPSSIVQYDLLLTSNIRFGRPATIYHGHLGDLDRKIPVGDKEMNEAYQQAFGRFIAQIENSRSIAGKIEYIIRSSTGRIPHTDEMAQALGMSRRTFQRELQRQGTTYNDVIRNFRMLQATNLLKQNGFCAKRTAFALGFANAGSFRRAFQDWMGQSIEEWRSGDSGLQI